MELRKFILLIIPAVALCGCQITVPPGGGGGKEPAADETLFEKVTDCGVYRVTDKSVSEYLKYTEGGNQYSTYSNLSVSVYSIVSLDDLKAVKVKFPNGTLDVGSDCSLTVESYGIELRNGTYPARLIKKSGDTYWFLDETSNTGYVVSK